MGLYKEAFPEDGLELKSKKKGEVNGISLVCRVLWSPALSGQAENTEVMFLMALCPRFCLKLMVQ